MFSLFAAAAGVKLYPNIIAEDDGTPISEEVLAPAGRQTEGVNMLPFGGTREGGAHKGFGLAMIGDLWANALGVSSTDKENEDGRVSSGGAGAETTFIAPLLKPDHFICQDRLWTHRDNS